MADLKERVWKVTFNAPGEHKYSYSSCKTVIAETMESAMEKIKNEYPDAEFMSINHHGVVDIK